MAEPAYILITFLWASQLLFHLPSHCAEGTGTKVLALTPSPSLLFCLLPYAATQAICPYGHL